jgi:ketosteroid isomerase-like protein
MSPRSTRSSRTTSSTTCPDTTRSPATTRGKRSVYELFRLDRRASFRSEIHDVLANDRHAVALTVVQGTRQGRVLEDITVHVVHVVDGKITESWLFPGDQAASDAFWS